MKLIKNRDDFDRRTAENLAKRAAYICSNPGCRALTLSPSDVSSEKHIYIGKAAHITAASKNGPRYDSTLTSEQRRSIENAIFLCSSCADIIDRNNGLDFSVKQLKIWKSEHETWVRENLNRSVTLLMPKIQIASIRILSEECLWEPEPMDGDLSSIYEIGFHQLPTFTWKKEQEEADRRVIDPIFDITLINSTNEPVLFTAVGFEALDAWSTLKGLPISGKVKLVDAY